MKYFIRFLFILVALITLAGCAGTGGLNSVSKTNNLSPGMNPKEVEEVFGEPSQTQFISEK